MNEEKMNVDFNTISICDGTNLSEEVYELAFWRTLKFCSHNGLHEIITPEQFQKRFVVELNVENL